MNRRLSRKLNKLGAELYVWDYSSIYKLLEFQLLRMAKYFKHSRTCINNKKHARRMLWAARLCRDIYTDADTYYHKQSTRLYNKYPLVQKSLPNGEIYYQVSESSPFIQKKTHFYGQLEVIAEQERLDTLHRLLATHARYWWD